MRLQPTDHLFVARTPGETICAACARDSASHAPCCFERCGKPATHKVGGEVYYPMCTDHAADWLAKP